MSMITRFRRSGMAVALSMIVALTIGGCATHAQDQDGPKDRAAGFPVTVQPRGGAALTLDAPPRRIVSLSPAETEILYGIDAGDQLVGVDRYSNYPPDAPRTGIDPLNPDPESIAKYRPDLVVASDDAGGLVSGLAKIDIPVLVVPAPEDIEQTYDVWRLLGRATGNVAAADRLVGQVRGELDRVVASAPEPAEPLTYFHELDPTLHSATSDTFIGKVYERFGLRNIADSAKQGPTAGYPQLSAEQVIKANPDLVFLADTRCCAANAATVADRPGWNVLNAVRNGTVVELNDDVASRWGPRLLQLVRAVGAAVAKASG